MAVRFKVIIRRLTNAADMPAKAALFDARANKIFDFGASPKNFVRYSPKGRLILMAGFGNLAGYIVSHHCNDDLYS